MRKQLIVNDWDLGVRKNLTCSLPDSPNCGSRILVKRMFEFCELQTKATESEDRSKAQNEFLTPRPMKAATDSAQDDEPVRPSSPKYDERTFFYTTPQVKVPKKAELWDSPAAKRAAQQAPDWQLKRKLAPGERVHVLPQLRCLHLLALFQQEPSH